MNNIKCSKLHLTIHSMYAAARKAECVCEPDVGCNYVDPRACKRCGFVNEWSDFANRGASQADHDSRCK